MSGEPTRFAGGAEALRRAFDRSFTEAPRADETQFEDLLTFRVERDPYAVRFAEVSGLFVDTHITRLPSDVPELLGIVAFRGTVVPVYDLRALLGYSSGEASRWLVLIEGPPAVALAFDQFDGHLRAPRGAIGGEDRPTANVQHVHGVVRTKDAVRRIVHLPSVLNSIKERVRHVRPRKDR